MGFNEGKEDIFTIYSGKYEVKDSPQVTFVRAKKLLISGENDAIFH